MYFAGRLKYFIEKWKAITNDNFILDAVLGYRLPFICKPQQFSIPKQPVFALNENIAITNQIEKLIAIKALKQIEITEAKFISKIFPVLKKDGSYRLVINLKDLNKSLEAPHFKMEDYRSVCALLRKDYYMSVIDLQDAYHLIPIHEDDQPFLCFIWLDKVYMYTCLPFGLNVAPYLFTKLLKPVMKVLRAKGLLSVIFLDDIWLTGKSEKDCNQNCQTTLHLLNELGFVVNEKKSMIFPSQNVKYLGFHFNSIDMIVQLPESKKQQIIKLSYEIIRKHKIGKLTCMDLAKYIGTLVAACPAVPYSPLYVRSLEMDKTRSLYKDNYNCLAKLSNESVSDINWWLRITSTAKMKVADNSYDLCIATDASLTGWGAHSGESKTRGFWSVEEKQLHINSLELLAIFNGLKVYANFTINARVLIRTDSTTALAYINKFGGCRSDPNNSIAKCIWKWCEERRIFIFASYITSVDNVLADACSRDRLDSSEYKLNSHCFAEIISKFGRPIIDLFASQHSTQCEKYFSWFPDPHCSGVDAFTITWDMYFYAFPPFCLVAKVLKKVLFDRGTGIVVVPWWETQVWFPQFLQMRKSSYIMFKPQHDLLISPLTHRAHPLSKNLKLCAAVVSGVS